MRAHEHDQLSRMWETKFDWRGIVQADESYIPDLFQTCTYCGSLTIDDAIKAFQTKGTQYSGCDWKYGWPHKFYLDIPCEPFERIISSRYNAGEEPIHEKALCAQRHHKFYACHLIDATEEQLKRWNEIAAPLVGIKYSLKNGNLGYGAVARGHQAWGEVK